MKKFFVTKIKDGVEFREVYASEDVKSMEDSYSREEYVLRDGDIWQLEDNNTLTWLQNIRENV